MTIRQIAIGIHLNWTATYTTYKIYTPQNTKELCAENMTINKPALNILEDHLLGKGNCKIVYRHPHDADICIKFPNKRKRALTSILREIKYLKKHQGNLPWVTPYLGSVDTNLGIGYMYPIVRNEDGSLSQSISTLDCQDNIDSIKIKVSDMYNQVIEQHAVINDLGSSNIFFRKKNNGDFDLILIDGFGNNDYIKIADYSKYFLILKLNRKFTRLCNNLNISTDFLIK